ncbi:MAG: alpha/beta hydrolase [Treponema sp.]|nr:alpha/beta hydrolase [Treponema sp.]
MAANADRETISIKVTEPIFYLDEEVTFAQNGAWFEHVTRDLRMNIIYPQTDNKTYPCVIWICGGYWTQMSKSAHIPYLADLARRGFVTASVEYRLGHEAPFPGALIDIKAAVRYLRANAKRYSIDINKFGVAGESAGGYLASMTALVRSKEFEKGGHLDQSSAVQAACPWYAPCDLTALIKENMQRPLFFAGDINDKQYLSAINPLTWLTAEAPPFLLIHGTEDTTVPFVQSEILYEALKKQNIDVRLLALEGEGHAGAQFFQRPLWDIMTDFFREKLG